MDNKRHIPIVGTSTFFRIFLKRDKNKTNTAMARITAALSGMDVISANATVNTMPDTSIGRFILG